MLIQRTLLVLLSVSILAAQPSEVPTSNSIRLEAKRRHEALIKGGYNLTHGFSWESQRERKPIRLEFLVPETQSEHQFSFWLETNEGEAFIQLLNPGGQALVSWSGRKGEMIVSRRIPTGKYALEIHPTRTSVGRAEFGVMGPLMQKCELDPIHVLEYPATPLQGFHWPYLLFMPNKIKFPTLLVVPNNTGFAVEDVELLRTSAACEIQRQSVLAKRLGCPLLVPMFPRPAATSEDGNLYLHALSRASLITPTEAWKRVDLQLLHMIHSARERLLTKGIVVSQKVLLSGFSAAGSFVNRFTLLHPEHVWAVACGSPGGWPMAPVSEVGGERLGYPVGVADMGDLTGSPFKLDALKSVHWFFFLGDQDSNDAVPYRDSFSKSDAELIFHRFGPTPVARWEHARRLYSSQGLPARFVRYPGVPHVVTPEIETDIALFFENRLKATFGHRLEEPMK